MTAGLSHKPLSPPSIGATDARRPKPLMRVLQPIVSPETWSATRFLVATFFVGAWWFVAVVTLLVAGIATLIVAVGVPLLATGLSVARSAAVSERRRVRAVGVELAPPAPAAAPAGGGWKRLRSELDDPMTPRNLAHILALLTLGPIWFSLVVVAWAVPLSFLATPVMVAAGFEPTASSEAGGWEIVIDSMSEAGVIAAVGALLLPVAPRAIMAMARAHGRVAERLLGRRDSVATIAEPEGAAR